MERGIGEGEGGRGGKLHSKEKKEKSKEMFYAPSFMAQTYAIAPTIRIAGTGECA